MTILIIFGFLCLIVAVLLAAHVLYNFVFCLRPSKRGAKPNQYHGLVTVMIPARNEEKVIEKCLRSLMAQDYPEMEVILYNDQSTDQTGVIADRLAKEDARIQVFHGTHLPAGWVGKTHGCHQMSCKAKGRWFLFGDSDTVYEPDAISRALATAEDKKLEFLSFFPRFDNYSLGEKIFLPFFYFYIYAFCPLARITSSLNPQVVAANGSFILIKQSLYQSIGGHESVKDKVLEDVLMARHIKSLGYKAGYGDGSTLYSVHMYDNIKSIWEGFSKNAFALFTWNYFTTITFVTAGFLFCVVPFILLVVSASSHYTTVYALNLSVVMIYLLIHALINFHLKQGFWTVVLFPICAAMSFFVIINSMFRVATGKGLTWKGRSYAK